MLQILPPEHETKSIRQQTTFARDLRDDIALETSLKKLAAEVGHNLRRENLAASTVKIKLRWPDFTTLGRQVTLTAPADQTAIKAVALALFRQARASGQAGRLLGIGVSNLGPPIHQLELWDKPARSGANCKLLSRRYKKSTAKTSSPKAARNFLAAFFTVP